MNQNTARIWWIDELRGLSILAMIVHHIAFNLVYFLELPLPHLSAFLDSGAFLAVQTVFIAIFLGLSGICSHLSRRPLRRALKVLAAAAAVTAVTYFLFPEEPIYFGILHFLAFCMLLAAVGKKVLIKMPPTLGIILCLLLFLLTFHLPDGFLGFGALSLPLPKGWYQGGIWTAFGFASPFFTSLDYVPIFPYVFLFLGGFFLGIKELPKGTRHSRFLAFCGRHSLFVYLLHQPLIFGISLLLEKVL